MQIHIREVEKVSIIDIEGKIDINSAEIIETIGWLLKSDKNKFIFNFNKVEAIDYSGLSILAIVYKNVYNHKAALKFTNVHSEIIELLKLVRLDEVFEVYDNESIALASFKVPFHLTEEVTHLRRRFRRLNVHLTVKYRLLIESIDKDKRYLHGVVMNLSGNGIFIFSHDIYPLGTMLELELHLSVSEAPLILHGRVTWLADRELQRHYYPGMGVNFVNISSEPQAQIVNFVGKNITHRSDLGI